MTQAELYHYPDWDEPSDPDGDELDRLQRRINALKDRIHDSLPEGYDMAALIAAAGELGGEDVFDITSDEFVLGGLAGPLIVPGAQPQPAFGEFGRHAENEEVRKFTTSYGRWGRVLLLLVLAAALAAAAYFGGLWWASRGAGGGAVSLGLAPVLLAVG
jgi:hypothetical protein